MSSTETLPRPQAANSATMNFADAVRARYSVRAFRPEPLPDAVIEEVLADAQCAPSNCNTQPWLTHIVSGETRDRLSAAMVAAASAGQLSPDFSFSMEQYFDRFADRRDAQGAALYGALGIARDDEAGRFGNFLDNFKLFNAPHLALLFMPSFGDHVRAAGDIGMYGQTLLLALAARGLGGVPQTAIGFMAGTVREVLGISPDYKLLFGISFGHPDPDAPVNQFRSKRAPLAESVMFHR